MRSALIVRDWYEIEQYRLTPDGHCPDCNAQIAGHLKKFNKASGTAYPYFMSGACREITNVVRTRIHF